MNTGHGIQVCEPEGEISARKLQNRFQEVNEGVEELMNLSNVAGFSPIDKRYHMIL